MELKNFKRSMSNFRCFAKFWIKENDFVDVHPLTSVRKKGETSIGNTFVEGLHEGPAVVLYGRALWPQQMELIRISMGNK